MKREMPPIHPAANLFPMLPDVELRELAADIKANGLQQPIVMFGAQLLDGRNRWRACEMANIEPRVRDWNGDDPVAFVVSLNLKRRHLDESQRAMVAARIATMRQGSRTDIRQICGKSQEQAADLLNVSPRSVGDARKVIEKGAPQLAAAVEAGEIAVSTAAVIADMKCEEQGEILRKLEVGEARNAKEAIRQFNREERIVRLERASAPLDLGRRYPIILADPPWQYDDADSRGAAEDHYPTMDTTAIAAIPVEKHATDDAVLFLWATSALLPDAMRVMGQWGFEYRSSAVWVKSRIGLGHWFRIRHEFLLVGVRGRMPPPATGDRPDSVIHADLSEHSRKPDEVHALIKRMWPSLDRLELFARRPVDGFDVWGNQAKGDAA